MALILNIETATPVCSVALCSDRKIIAKKESQKHNSHSSLLTVFIEEIFNEINFDLNLLDAIAVSKGPGSYTGLRIGVSTSKGLCYALDKPLIAINTLMAMANGMVNMLKRSKSPLFQKSTLLCPMIDARRMEVYSAIFDIKGNEIRGTIAEIIDENSYNDFLINKHIIFFGDGAAKCKKVLLGNDNVKFIDDFCPSAEFMADISDKEFKNNKFEDVAYFEPFYLKDFIAGKPKVKGLY